MALAVQKTPPPEDDLDELPPLDGDDGEPGEASPEDEAIDEHTDSGDPFDDTTGEDDAVDAKELDTGNVEGGWLDESAEADDLELGGVELVAFEGEPLGASDFEEPGIGNEDFGLGAGEGLGLDGGEEGPVDDDEDMRDEDLPPLDADEEGELDDAELMEPGFTVDEPVKPRGKPWKAAGAPIGLGATSAVACVAKGVLAAAGGKVFRADLEGACEPLPGVGLEGSIVALGAEDLSIVALAEGGDLFASRDAGESFARVRRGVSAAFAAGGALWALTSDGELLSSRNHGVSWDAPLGTVRCAAVAQHGTAVAALLVDDAGAPRELVMSVAAGERVALPPGGEPPAKGATLAVRGKHVAIAGGEAGVAAQIWDGERWANVNGFAPASAMAFLDDAGSLLFSSENDAGDGAWLVVVSPAREASIVFDVDGESPRAIARDDAHGVAWICGAEGLLAVESGE